MCGVEFLNSSLTFEIVDTAAITPVVELPAAAVANDTSPASVHATVRLSIPMNDFGLDVCWNGDAKSASRSSYTTVNRVLATSAVIDVILVQPSPLELKNESACVRNTSLRTAEL